MPQEGMTLKSTTRFPVDWVFRSLATLGNWLVTRPKLSEWVKKWGQTQSMQTLIYEQNMVKYYGPKPISRFMLGTRPYVIATKAPGFEAVLRGRNHLDKGDDYKWVATLIGNNLLTEHSKTWVGKRNLLTPAFHLHMLKNALIIMNEQSRYVYAQLLSCQASLETCLGQTFSGQTPRFVWASRIRHLSSCGLMHAGHSWWDNLWNQTQLPAWIGRRIQSSTGQCHGPCDPTSFKAVVASGLGECHHH